MDVFGKSLVLFFFFILSVTAAEKNINSQEMSTGESPMAYIERKVKEHQVSSLWLEIRCFKIGSLVSHAFIGMNSGDGFRSKLWKPK
jgi:hypothetical protein